MFSESDLQKIIRIQFDAVYHDAVIYINELKKSASIQFSIVGNNIFVKQKPLKVTNCIWLKNNLHQMYIV